MTYDVIIVNYNGEAILERCLESVYASVPAPANVIIYDNASTDRSCELIRRSFPQVRLIEGPVNIGFGPGNNAAMEHATSDALLFMNNDVILDPHCAAELLAALDLYPEAAIVNPMIYGGWDLDRRDRIYSFGATINASGFGYSLIEPGEDTDRLSCFSGACLIARTSVMRKNPFQPRYFLYLRRTRAERAAHAAKLSNCAPRLGRLLALRKLLDQGAVPRRHRLSPVSWRRQPLVHARPLLAVAPDAARDGLQPRASGLRAFVHDFARAVETFGLDVARAR